MAGFSLFGSATGGRYPYFNFLGAQQPQQPSDGFSAEDLYQPTPPVQYPAAPPPIASTADLSPEAKRELRRRALILAAQAFSAPGGQIGSALAGAAGESQAGREAAIERARAQQQQTYQQARQAAEEDAQRRRQEVEEKGKGRRAQALYGAYAKIKEGDPALASEAETAALRDDSTRLRELLASIPARKAMRAHGVDPDDPAAVANYAREQKLQDDLAQKDALEQQRLGYLPKELEIRDASENAQTAYRLGLEDHYRTVAEGRRAAREAAKAAKTGQGGRQLYLDRKTGKWMERDEAGNLVFAPGVQGGYRDQALLINGRKYAWNSDTGVAVPIKTQEELDAEKKKKELEAKEEARRARGDLTAGERIGVAARNALRLGGPPPPPANVGAKPVVSAPQVKKPSPAAPAPHVLQQPDTAPSGPGGRVTTDTKKVSPLRGKGAAKADAGETRATGKLDAIADPGTKAKIRAARAEGHSDDEIARFLGLM